MNNTIWHLNTDRPQKDSEILCVGHNESGDFIIYGTTQHHQDTFCIVDNVEVEYASDIEKWCYVKDLLNLLQKIDNYK